MVAKLDRDNLLKYKPKKVIDFNSTFLIKNKFDKNILNFKELAKKAFSTFKIENPLFKEHKLMVINTTQNNILSIFVNEFKFQVKKTFSFKRCALLNCKTCIYSNLNENIFLTKKFILPLLNDSNCSSENLIYIIY